MTMSNRMRFLFGKINRAFTSPSTGALPRKQKPKFNRMFSSQPGRNQFFEKYKLYWKQVAYFSFGIAAAGIAGFTYLKKRREKDEQLIKNVFTLFIEGKELEAIEKIKELASGIAELKKAWDLYMQNKEVQALKCLDDYFLSSHDIELRYQYLLIKVGLILGLWEGTDKGAETLRRIFDLENVDGTVFVSKMGEMCDQAIKLDPKNFLAYQYKSRLLANKTSDDAALKNASRCYDECLRHMTEMPATDPRILIVWLEKAEVHTRLKDFRKALQCYEEIIKVDDQSPFLMGAYTGKADCLVALSAYEESLMCYDLALGLNPTKTIEIDILHRKVSMFVEMGVQAKTNGEHTEHVKAHTRAVACFDRAIQLGDVRAEVYYNKANSLRELGQFSEATRVYNKALERYKEGETKTPKGAIYNNRGLSLEGEEKFQEANASYKEGMKLMNVKAFITNASLLIRRLNFFDEGIECYKQALESFPDEARFIYGQIGLLLSQLGIDDESTEFWLEPANYERFNKKNNLERMRDIRNIFTVIQKHKHKFMLDGFSHGVKPQDEGVLTHYDCAVLSNLVYHHGTPRYKVPDGWEEVHTLGKPENQGYLGVMYVNHKAKNIVVAHRGTYTSNMGNFFHNVITNAKYAGDVMDNLFSDAYRLVTECAEVSKKYPTYTVTQTGHSLGAIVAEVMAYLEDQDAVTFESPGSLALLQNHLRGEPDEDKVHVTGYFSMPNVVNTFRAHIGDKIRVYPVIKTPEPSTAYKVVSTIGEYALPIPPGWQQLVSSGVVWVWGMKVFDYVVTRGQEEIARHSMEGILECFVEEERGVRKKEGIINDWPKGLMEYHEYESGRVKAKEDVVTHHQRYEEVEIKIEAFNQQRVHYVVVNHDRYSMPLSKFTPEAREYLVGYREYGHRFYRKNHYAMNEKVLDCFYIERNDVEVRGGWTADQFRRYVESKIRTKDQEKRQELVFTRAMNCPYEPTMFSFFKVGRMPENNIDHQAAIEIGDVTEQTIVTLT